MARARNIKPGFFENEVLADLSISARLLFIGLWTLADREGRLEDRPKRIKMKLFPLDEGIDVDGLLEDLQKTGFLVRYGTSTRQARCKHERLYIQIVNFAKHQSPHCKEKPSTIPAPDEHGASTVQAEKSEGLTPPDSLNPDSLNPEKNNVGDSGESRDVEDGELPSGEKEAAQKPKWTQDDKRIAEQMLRDIRTVAPSAKASRRWPDDVRLMREQDGLTYEEIIGMFRWANTDSFWRANILSPGKLRQQWATLEAQRNTRGGRNPPPSAHGGFENLDYSSGIGPNGEIL